MADVKIWVDEKIAGKKVVVFSKSYCPYCKNAKSAIRKHIPADIKEEDLEWIEIESRDDMQAIQSYLKQLTGASSVPRVFVGGKTLGGCDETLAADRSGKLKELMRA